MDLSNAEINHLESVVEKLNSTDDVVTYRLIESKGTYYIHPQFPATE